MATAPASSIIARVLEDQIGAGELQPGDRTPSVRDLARDFGVSPATASKALNHLAALGLIEARPGVGMIVLQPRASQLRSRDRIAVAERTGKVNRPGEYAKRLSAGEEKADARVRAGLGIDTARAFCRRRVRYDASDRPIEHSSSWFALDVAARAPRLSDLAAIEEGTLAYVQEATGRTVASTHEDLYAREADDFDVAQGVASPGRPVLVVEFVAYDENERALTFEVAVFPERVRVVGHSFHPGMTPLELVALGVAAIVGSAAQSATGFGVALALSPVAFALLPPPNAVLTVAAGSLMQNLLVLVTRHRRLALRIGDAAVLVVAALPGLFIGAVVVSHASKPPMQLAVGVAILAAVLFRLHEPGRFAALASREIGAPVGALAGFLTTTVGVNGPPLVMWLRARDATFTQLRDTLAIIFLSLNLAAIPSLTTRGGAIPAALVPVLAAGLVVGHVVGLEAHHRLSGRALDRVLVFTLTAAAGASIIGAATALL